MLLTGLGRAINCCGNRLTGPAQLEIALSQVHNRRRTRAGSTVPEADSYLACPLLGSQNKD
jgi:hypothetical protein